MVEMRKLRIGLDMDNQGALLATLHVRPVLVERILAAQSQDPLICTLRVEVANGDKTDCSIRNDGALMIGLLHPLPIPEWKWERITMDFMFKLPRTQSKHDGVWVIVDRLTKSAHFLPVRANYSLNKLAKIFIDEIVRLHGVPVSIVSDRDPRFTSRFWTKLNEAFGTQLQFSTAFHPQTDGQSERTIQTLEDMLRACALQFRGDWDEKLPLMEFAYNNSYQFEVGDWVFLKLSPWKGVVRFGKRGKLSPRYIGPYEIIERVGPAAYRLALPANLARLHDVFHISMLRKYISDSSHVLEEQPVELEEDFTYVEQLVPILDWKTQVLRSREIPLVKVLWRSHTVEEATWEPEDQMRKQYLHLFDSQNIMVIESGTRAPVDPQEGPSRGPASSDYQ
ncbi:hypothetical protein L3X38_025555 [Prunus dulcis]|uniref:Integrase catalytic domain-containing protein n=1 Tax=Prunus dulcis TaxID=3755 RepID=A0AAD4Z6H7_PRUDU|nr:hypothetical protein L3X38_025555 [Prunus dulcis]